MPEQLLNDTIHQCLIMLLTAHEKYMVAKGWLKERTYFTSRERGRHEGGETSYTVAVKDSGAD